MTAIHVSRRGFLGALASAAGALLVPKPKAISYFFGGLPAGLDVSKHFDQVIHDDVVSPGVQSYASMGEMHEAMVQWFGSGAYTESGDFTQEWLASRRVMTVREIRADDRFKLPPEWSERDMWKRRRAERQARRRRA